MHYTTLAIEVIPCKLKAHHDGNKWHAGKEIRVITKARIMYVCSATFYSDILVLITQYTVLNHVAILVAQNHSLFFVLPATHLQVNSMSEVLSSVDSLVAQFLLDSEDLCISVSNYISKFYGSCLLGSTWRDARIWRGHQS